MHMAKDAGLHEDCVDEELGRQLTYSNSKLYMCIVESLILCPGHTNDFNSFSSLATTVYQDVIPSCPYSYLCHWIHAE